MINLKQLQQTSNQALNDLLDVLNATNIFSLFKTSISIAMIQKTVDFNLINTVDDLNIAYAKSFVANFRALDTISTKINDNKIYDFLLAFRDLFLSLTIDKATSQSDVDWQNFLKLLNAIEFVFDDKLINPNVFTQLEELYKTIETGVAKHDFMLQQIEKSDASSLVLVIGSGGNYKQIAPLFAIDSSREDKTLVCNIDTSIYTSKLSPYYANQVQWEDKTDIFEQVNRRISDNGNISVILNNSNMTPDAMRKYSEVLKKKKAMNANFKVVFMYCESPIIPKYLSDAAQNLTGKNIFTIGKDFAFVSSYWIGSPCTVLHNVTEETAYNNRQLYIARGEANTFSSTETMEQCKETASRCQQDKSIILFKDLDELQLDNVLPNRFKITKQEMTQGSAASASSASSNISSKPPLIFRQEMSAASASSASSSIYSMSEEEQIEEAIQCSLKLNFNAWSEEEQIEEAIQRSLKLNFNSC